MIPKASETLSKELATLTLEAGGDGDPRLFNSLGAALISHKPALEHIQRFGKTPAIKEKAQQMYSGAFGYYLKVRDENDKLSVWYRSEKNDGKYSLEDYKKLLLEQSFPVDDIQCGDDLLRGLTAYLNELHEQYYVFVSSQTHKHKEFRHTRTHTHRDSKGNTHLEFETYYTDGYEYFYILTTVRPGGTTTEEIRVGEIDSLFFDWSYAGDEQVGCVRKWKRLHEDNTMIRNGWMRDLNPAIENE
jgi:hypothetical protein